jgi:hypothetical protein
MTAHEIDPGKGPTPRDRLGTSNDPAGGPAAMAPPKLSRGSPLRGVPKPVEEGTPVFKREPGPILPPQPRVKLLRPVTYAGTEYAAGALVVVDRESAMRWLHQGVAEVISEPPPLWPRCPQCHVTFQIPADGDPAATPWVQCPKCSFGWYRS